MKRSFLTRVLLAAVLAWVATQTTQAGWMKRYIYLNYTGTAVTNLLGTNTLGAFAFPCCPDVTEVIPNLTDPTPQLIATPQLAESALNGVYDNYGSFQPGYFEAPETGNYIFYCEGDDETQLWMTTNAATPLDPTLKQMIATVPGYTALRQWNKYPQQQSAPVYLEKGKQYYMEAWQKDGTGGDLVGLGVQLPSGEQQLPMSSFYLQPIKDTTNDLSVVNGPYVTPVSPMASYDYTIYDGMEVMLWANLNLNPPYTVQWYRDGNPLQDQTQTFYRFRVRYSADNGAVFKIRVNGIDYGPLTLSVSPDSTAPSLASAIVTPLNPTQVQLVFSEQVTPASATNIGNYSFNTASVQGATLLTDGRSVVLKTTVLPQGTVNTLTINHVADYATPANVMLNVQTNLLVTDNAVSYRYWNRTYAADLASLRMWATSTAPAQVYITNGFNEERTITTSSYQWNLSPASDNYVGEMIGYITAPESGYYRFAIASDDHSILYLGTNDTRVSKREICCYNGSTGRWNVGAQLATQQSELIYLQAGQRYYFEAVYRDGTGGDGVSVFWQTPSGPRLPTANQSVQSATEPFLIPTNCMSTFASTPVQGALTFRIWYTTFAPDSGSLRAGTMEGNSATYVNDAYTEERSITTNSYPWNLVPVMNNYEGQIIGYLTAPETGNYNFGIASDDHSILFLGTNELRSSKREICSMNGSSGRWSLTNNPATQRSSNVYLEAGKRYYFEAIYRDGTGGDGVSVFWYTPSMVANLMPWPPSPDNSASADAPYVVPIQYLSMFSTPGAVTLKSDLPAAFSAAESSRPVLSVVADGTRPYAYQWFKRGTAIPGATSASYTLPYVSQADDTATYQVVVTNNFSSVTSAVATLTVTSDTVKPTVASVGSLYKQTIDLRLSEPVTDATAMDPGNYILIGSTGAIAAVNTIVVDPNDPGHLTLQTAPLPETDLMTLVVQNLVDRSTSANVISPTTNTFRANNFDGLANINTTQAYRATAVGDQILMTAGGADIWGTADGCAYLYKTVTGNFDYRVRADVLPAINGWTKMGPMAREGLAPGARDAIPCFTPVTPGQNQYSAQVRETTGGNTTSSGDASPFPQIELNVQTGVATRPTVAYPSWLRLQRVGSALYYYYSTYGTNWTFWTFWDSAISAGGPLTNTMQIGIALTSHDTTTTADAVLGSFSAVDDGPLRFTLVPTNAVLIEGATANFYAGVAGHSPWWFQWLTNDIPVFGATNTAISFANVPMAMNNTKVTCQVSNPYGEVISTNAYIIVTKPDTTAPSVATVGSLLRQNIEVNFSEPVTAASAVSLANYSLYASDGTPITINFASQDAANAAHITLNTAELPELDLMTLVCRNLVDLSPAANTMTTPQTNAFRAFNFDAFERINNTQNYAAAAVGDQIIMTAGGSDIWGTSDQCAFLYKNVSGDFDYKVQGLSLPVVNQWSKMGLMARVSVTANERNNYICFTPNGAGGQNTYSPQVRTNAGTSTTSSDAGGGFILYQNKQAGLADRPTIAYPSWVRLQRVGSRIDYYYGLDGTNWTFYTWYDSAVSSDAGPLPYDLLVGLAITSHDTSQTVTGMLASFTAVVEGPLRFLAEPVSTTVEEGGTATFTALATGRSPLSYQWIKNGADIPGATATNLVLTHIPISDNGATFACRVSNPFGDSLTSSNAVLTVLQDTDKPIAYAVGSLNGTGVGVYFSDPNLIDPATGGDPVNYVVNGGAVKVTGATVEPDRLAVMLALEKPISGAFTVNIQNVKDGAPIPNTMDPTVLSSTVVTGPDNADIGTSTNPPALTDPIMPGFAQAIGTSGFYVHAGGHDIWDNADGMHFVYRAMPASFDVSVRVAGLLPANTWTKAGLMIRADLGADARNYLIAATPTTGQNLITMQWRPDRAATSLSVADAQRPRPSPIPNAWLRVTRTNQDLAFYWGTNGTDWVTYYTTNLAATPYPSTVYVGLATTSHDNGSSLTNVTSAYYLNLSGLETPPALTVALGSGNVAIGWTSTRTNLVLQGSPSLLPSNWQAVGITPVVNGSTYTVTVPTTNQMQYFRLVQP